MATAGDIINGALRKIGMLAEGETPSAETSADALTVLNDFIDALSLERLMIYATQDQQFTWTANTATRTLGASGNLVGNRPVRLDPATYYRDAAAGISFPPPRIITQEEYNTISAKTQTSTYPEVLYVNYTMPNITMTLYPVPTVALEWHFVSVLELTQPATLATELTVPPGYRKYFRNQLAVEVAAEFGVAAPPDVKRIAAASKRLIKRTNKQDMGMSLPGAVVGMGGRADIFSGV